jgi:hypothetical protein
MFLPSKTIAILFDLLDFFPRLLSYILFRYNELNGYGFFKKGSP